MWTSTLAAQFWDVALAIGDLAAMVAVFMVPFFIYEIVMALIKDFRNNDSKKWPSVMPPNNKGAKVDAAAWAIRLFSDEGCGNHPVYGDNPSASMMAELVSSDLHYNDLQPCQNFMIEKSHDVSSVAVMITVRIPQSFPLCSYSSETFKLPDEDS